MASEPGRVVGNYQVEGVLGRGGMGVVYRAQDLRLGRPVALKLLAAHVATDLRYRDRFLRERRAAAAIDHPNVLPVYEAGEADGELFIAMRLVGGEDLEALLERNGPLEPARAVALLAQVADALDAIHRHGLVHRDVKPSNVMIDTAGAREHAYVTDFGVAKLSADATPLTDTGSFMGTVDYCAPEVIRGDVLDARADVYSLGCVLYECLVGAKPFKRETQLAIIYAHLEDPPPSVRDRRPELPAGLDAVVARALAKDPDERYQTAGAMAEAAQAAIAEATPGGGTATVSRPIPEEKPPPGPPRSRRPAVIAGLVALGVAVVAVAAIALSGGGGDDGGGGGSGPAVSATASTGRAVVGSRLVGAPGDSGYCTGDGGAACTLVQLTLGKADQAVPADGVITRWSVRGGKGRLALRVIDGPAGRRRIVAKGSTVRVPGPGVQTFSARVPVSRGQYVGVEVGTDGYLPIRYLSEDTRVDKWQPPLGPKPTPNLADASGTNSYELAYNATIEPDDDHDGSGDLTQDPDHGGAGEECPTDGVLARGAGSSVVRDGDAVFGCRGGVRTPVGAAGGLSTFAFAGDQLAAVRRAGGKSSVLGFDLGDRNRTFASSETFDDDRPADWKVTDVVVASNGDAAWMSAPRGAPDRTGVWTRNRHSVQQIDSGRLKAGSLRLKNDESGITYEDTDGGAHDSGF